VGKKCEQTVAYRNRADRSALFLRRPRSLGEFVARSEKDQGGQERGRDGAGVERGSDDGERDKTLRARKRDSRVVRAPTRNEHASRAGGSDLRGAYSEK